MATSKCVETQRACAQMRDLHWKSDGTIATLVWFGQDRFQMVELTPGQKPNPEEEARLEEKIRDLREHPEREDPGRGRLYSGSLSADGRWVIAVRHKDAGAWTEVNRFTHGETSETIRPEFRLDAASGGRAWLSDDGKVLLSSVEKANDRSGRLLAFDVTAKGKLVWSLTLPDNKREPVACFSPHGTEVAIHFSDGVVELWDGPLGTRIRAFPTVPNYRHHNSIEHGVMARSSDGTRMALLYRSADGALGGRVVDVRTGADRVALESVPTPRFFSGACFSPDGSRIALVASGVVRIWNADPGADACPLPGHRGTVTSLAVIDDKTVATTGADLTVRVWNPTTGEELWQTGLRERATIAFATPDGLVLSQQQSWSTETPAIRIDPASGRKKSLPGKLGEAKRTYPLAVSPDGAKIATFVLDSQNPAWEIWSWPAGERLTHLPVQPPGRLSVNFCDQAHFSPDGRQLVVVPYYDDPAEQQTMRRVPAHPFIERWEIATGKLLDRFKPSRGDPPQLLSGPNGLWSWTASTEIRDALTGRLVVKLLVPAGERIAVHGSHAAAISADGTSIAIGEHSFGADPRSRIFVFDLKTGERTRVLCPGRCVNGLRFLADGRIVSIADVALVWNAAVKKP